MNMVMGGKFWKIGRISVGRKHEKTIGGVDVFFLGQSTEDFGSCDLVVDGRFCVVGVYYCCGEYPRFRVAFSDDLFIDGSGAVVAFSDLVGWEADSPIIEGGYFLMAHNFGSEEEFKAWELEAMSKPFMSSQGCDFIAEAVGEWEC